MNHGINVLTIAKTPVTKKCLNKLTLKKAFRNNNPETKHGDYVANQNILSIDKDEIVRSEYFSSTPPFFTKRKKNVKISPLFPLNNDSNSDSSIPKPNLLDDSNNGSSSEPEIIQTHEDYADYSFENFRQSLPSSTILTETPKNNESVPSDITPDTANIMDSLYGDIWRSTPGLFKKKKCKVNLEKIPLGEKEMNINSENRLESKHEKDDDFELNFKSLNIRDENAQKEISKLIENDLVIPNSNNLPVVKKTKRKSKVNSNLTKEINDKDVKKHKLPTSKPKLKSNDDIFKTTNSTNVNLDLHLKPCKLNFNDDKFSNKENKVIKEKEKPKVLPKEDKLKLKNENIHKDKPETYSFMASLAENLPSWRRDLKAKYYIENFKTKKEELATLLFQMFNKNVFDTQIDPNLCIFWSKKLQTTAGRAHNKLVKVKDIRYGDGTGRRSRVELSIKVLDTPQRLRDTLAHELCHVAAWIIDGNLKDGHGPVWKAWVKRVLKSYPEIEKIPVCHSLDIHFKYSFKCTKCGYKINRHSKSIDINKQCCGFCRGKFECIQNKKTKEGLIVSTPVNQRKELKGFALYVKEHYGNVRGVNTPHKEAMKFLGRKYAETQRQPKGSEQDS